MPDIAPKRKPGRPKGAKAPQNRAKHKLTDEILKAFERANRDRGWLDNLFSRKPEVAAGLLAKIIPSEIKADINQTVTLDISQAIIDAKRRQIELEQDKNIEGNVIDITPDASKS